MLRARAMRIIEAGGVALDVVPIERTVVGEMHQQPAEQRRIGAGLQPEEQIVVADGIGPARIDHDMRAPRCCLLASMRWYSTGWHQAALEPTSTRRSASSRSS